MGYRSQGKLVMSATDLAKIERLPLYPKVFFEDYSDSLEIVEDRDSACLEYSGLKMYKDYQEIAEFYAFLDYLDENNMEYSYIEIGEDPQDITERGDGGDLYVSRSIEYT